ncbi:p-loop containing NTP hydrolase pore-1 domain-containing protein [Ditylenchus destructor]|nr:p-loop containing NTP hydrolase pore-1 domain-containing protein [Ditylenchus destructor]
MDDLLLTALSESGLDEFVFETEEQPSTSTQVQTHNEITAMSAMPSTSSYEPPQIRRLDEDRNIPPPPVLQRQQPQPSNGFYSRGPSIGPNPGFRRVPHPTPQIRHPYQMRQHPSGISPQRRVMVISRGQTVRRAVVNGQHVQMRQPERKITYMSSSGQIVNLNQGESSRPAYQQSIRRGGVMRGASRVARPPYFFHANEVNLQQPQSQFRPTPRMMDMIRPVTKPLNEASFNSVEKITLDDGNIDMPLHNRETIPHEEDETEQIQVDTYIEYHPPKLRSGLRHPDIVVETVSLSSVGSPEIRYTMSIPETVVDEGKISALQLEAALYACQAHEKRLPTGERVGYLIGDGAGVGKGRTIATIIYENYLLERKRSIWLSASSDLRFDAERDLRDIGASFIPVYALNKLKYAKINGNENGNIKKGVIFSTYSSLVGESKNTRSPYGSRLKQILQWCGKEFDGVIVFDECHRAKNLCPTTSAKSTKAGRFVVELQHALPSARVVYASATGATEPRNMAYMTRIGLWGMGLTFTTFADFIHAVENRGVGAMEMVAMDMKVTNFKGVGFRVAEVPLSRDFVNIYDESVRLWMECRRQFARALRHMPPDDRKIWQKVWSHFWSAHQRFFKYLCISAKVEECVNIALHAIKQGKCVVIGLQSTGESQITNFLEDFGEPTEFVSTAKAVLQSLIEKHFPSYNDNSVSAVDDFERMFLSMEGGTKSRSRKRRHHFLHESPYETRSTRRRFASGEDPWAKSQQQLDEPPLEKKLAEARAKEAQVTKKTPSPPPQQVPKKPKVNVVQQTSASDFINSTNIIGSKDDDDDGSINLTEVKTDLLAAVERLGKLLPPNTLDQLINQLGGPSFVAEMTGRRGRITTNEGGEVKYELRNADSEVPVECMNLEEKDKFMGGEKLVAIISEAASSGISLQSDRRAANQLRRVHITLELPWSADKAIQQFGRTHRSNQVSGPEYVFLISELAGEKRFASTVAKRLESLGALTHGDRRATESRDLSQFNIDNKYGREALEILLKTIVGAIQPLIPPPTAYTAGNFFKDMRTYLEGVGMLYRPSPTSADFDIVRDTVSIAKFLNRLLGLPVHAQNLLFQYFNDIVLELIRQAKLDGTYDMGIMDIGVGSDRVQKTESRKFEGSMNANDFLVEMHKISLHRGVSWEEAHSLLNMHHGPHDGYYFSYIGFKKKVAVSLVFGIGKAMEGDHHRMFCVTRPNTGRSPKFISLNELSTRFTKVSNAEAMTAWKEQYDQMERMCYHQYFHGKCTETAAGKFCEVGRRNRTYFILSGSVICVWPALEEILADAKHKNRRMQIVRVKTDNNQKIIGLLVLPNHVVKLVKLLEERCR